MRNVLAAATLLFAFSSAFAQYPQRPVQLIVPWGAGGGTDATARIIATLLEKELKQPFNVVNRTGGSGVVGHDAIAKATPDGYTIGLITVEITMMHHVGLTPLKHTDYTPIGLVNADPAGINVRVDAPYKSVKDLLAAIKANPGKLKASGTGQGGIWHLAIAGLLKDQGIDPNALPWVPSQGAAPCDGTHGRAFGSMPCSRRSPAIARCQIPPWPVPEALSLPGFALMAASRSFTDLYGASTRTLMPAGSALTRPIGV